MKKLTCTLLCLCLLIGILSCSSSKTVSLTNFNRSVIKGSWLLLEVGGVPVEHKQIKHYTDNYFVWHSMDQSNMILRAGAGEYKLSGNDLLEMVDMTTYDNSFYKGNTAQIKIEIDNDTLYQSTVLPSSQGEFNFTEKWLRLK